MNKYGTLILMLVSPFVNGAMHLSETGTGQVALVPFYTVANGLNTLISVNNTSTNPKAIKVHIRDAKLGQSIYSFNLYLDSNDIWVMALSENEGQVSLISNDTSCTLGIETPEPSESLLTTNGFIEILEMGEISDELGLFEQFSTQEENCQTITAHWGEEDLWAEDAGVGMLPAKGGLHVTGNVVNVAQGYAFPVHTKLIDHFYDSSVFLHTAPNNSLPDLSSGTTQSLIYHQGEAVKTNWPTGYEAVSALMMKITLENEYSFEEHIGAKTEWVMSFPTLRYHLNGQSGSTPFLIHTGSNGDTFFNFPNNFGYDYFLHDREAQDYPYFHCGLPCGPRPLLSLKHHVNVYLILDAYTDFDPLLTNELSANAVIFTSLTSEMPSAGKLRFVFTEELQHSIPNDRGISEEGDQTHIFHGLPVVGFSFQAFKNSNAQPGLLASYATSQPHYSQRKIEIIENQTPNGGI